MRRVVGKNSGSESRCSDGQSSILDYGSGDDNTKELFSRICVVSVREERVKGG
jgi:hypothetical protein